MKRILPLIFTLLAAVSCEDWLVREPKDELSPDTYFTTEEECRLYTNRFYLNFPGGSGIYGEEADYIIPASLSSEVAGNRTIPSTASSWNWDNLRDINFFIVNSGNCSDAAARDRYLGLARFFRAYFYFEKVKRYGDVPWVDEPLDATDSRLYKGRDDRKSVMANVLEDINFAIANLPAEKSVYTVTRWTALALKSRIFLFEGTFRKYHGLGDWQECLENAAAAAGEFIQSSGYGLYTSGSTPYLSLFNSQNADPKEIILCRGYSSALKLVHDVNGRYTSTTMGKPGLAKDVVNSYLCSDGTRFTDRPGYATMQFLAETADRDPRLAQTIRTPGYSRLGSATKLAPNLAASTTGYQIIKYVAESKYDSYNTSENDLPLFRTAEVYLNYAEALAELGTLTQADLDKSVNKLRARVGMTNMNLAWSNANPDPYLQAAGTGYPGVDGPDAGIILEIRRERTVELVAEGFRYWDIMRWKAGSRFVRPFLGMYFPGTGSYDLDGNGTVDFILYEGPAPAASSGVVIMSLEEAGLTGGMSGNITVHGEITRRFDENKDYLYPVPTDDRVLTGGTVSQNPGWEDGLSF